MKRLVHSPLALLIRTVSAALLLVALLAAAERGEPPSVRAAEIGPTEVPLLELEGVIGPASSDFLVRGIERAEEAGAPFVIVRMNTPGGLDTSMRAIIQKILSAQLPVVTYVAPQGSRAASAGTYILYASHVAAMAPATNLGAATPVQMSPGGLPGSPRPRPGDDETAPEAEPGQENGQQEGQGRDEQAGKEAEPAAPEPKTAMERKIVNDAVAYIRGLALMRGRNAEWAERAVREGVSLTAEDALAENVIDLVAGDVRELMTKLDGYQVEVLGSERTLETDGLTVVTVEPDWRSRLLAIITNPNVAYILMMLGVYGLFFELSNPGNVLPGVAGAICLVLALYAFHVLPVNYAGVALILLGIAFMVGEAFVPSFGALGIGGAIAFVIGSLILVDTDIEGFELSLPLVIAIAAVSTAFFVSVMTMALRQRRRPVVSGMEELVGGVGEALDTFEREGRIRAHSEIWHARTAAPVEKGQRVRIRAMDGLVLEVEPLAKEN